MNLIKSISKMIHFLNLKSQLSDFKKYYRTEFVNFVKNNKFYSFSLVFYCLFTAVLYLHYKVMVFDEVWFFCCFDWKNFNNHLGYGYLYWLFIGWFHSVLILRILSLFCIWSIPYFIYKFGQKLNVKSQQIKLVTYLWLTYPASWWFGKLIGVELYCVAIGFIGLYLAMFSLKRNFGIFLMGIVAGIKVTFIIYPFFYYSYFFLNNIQSKNILKSLISIVIKEKMGLFFFLGFFIANPTMLLSPDKSYRNIIAVSSVTNVFDFNYQLEKFYGGGLGNFWETVINQSLTHFSLHFFCIVVLLVFLVFRLNKNPYFDKKLTISFILSLILNIVLVFKNNMYMNCYFFPIIVLSVLFFLNLQIKKNYLLTIVVINFLLNLLMIFAQIHDKIAHIKNYYNRNEINSIIDDYKNNFISRYPKSEQCISIDPPSGSCIILLNKYLSKEKVVVKPFFIAISSIMMVNYIDRSSAYGYLKDYFNNNQISNFKNSVAEINGKFIDKVHDIYIFTIIPSD